MVLRDVPLLARPLHGSTLPTPLNTSASLRRTRWIDHARPPPAMTAASGSRSSS